MFQRTVGCFESRRGFDTLSSPLPCSSCGSAVSSCESRRGSFAPPNPSDCLPCPWLPCSTPRPPSCRPQTIAISTTCLGRCRLAVANPGGRFVLTRQPSLQSTNQSNVSPAPIPITLIRKCKQLTLLCLLLDVCVLLLLGLTDPRERSQPKPGPIRPRSRAHPSGHSFGVRLSGHSKQSVEIQVNCVS